MLTGEEKFVFNSKQETYIIKLKEKKSFFDFLKSDTKPDVAEPKYNKIKTEAPREGCRAFITDLVVGDEYIEDHISEIYKIDVYSDYVGAGKYNDCKIAFPNAAEGTFDGIAVDKGTRIIIYSKPNFKGKKILDITCPAIINNRYWRKDKRYGQCDSKAY